MTIGMLVECMAGKSGGCHGIYQDATPFRFNRRRGKEEEEEELGDETDGDDDDNNDGEEGKKNKKKNKKKEKSKKKKKEKDKSAVEYFGEQLVKAGFNYYGNEPMYSGVTGELLQAEIFFGV
jgi:DNA-directed RNA polymerase I subunit RPA2